MNRHSKLVYFLIKTEFIGRFDIAKETDHDTGCPAYEKEVAHLEKVKDCYLSDINNDWGVKGVNNT